VSSLENALAGNIVQRRLYAYTTPADKVRPWAGKRHGVGLIKVGETIRQDVKKRIWEQFQTASTTAEPFELLLDEPALTTDGRSYRDTDIHKVLTANGVHRVTGEWFEGTIADVRAAMLQIDTGTTQSPSRVATFGMRPEQQAAVDLTAAFFEKNTKDQSSSAPHFLWNAKMRFGKTFTTYQLAKKMGWTRILVLTYKPAVKTAWKEDLEGHTDFAGWQFKDADVEWDTLDETKPIVWFASFQDMLGRDKDGQPKAKNEEAHLVDWDCVVLDEYHFGSWRDSAKDLYDPTESDAALDAGDDFAEDTFPLTVRHFLYLSGTPFRALNEGQFSEDSIFNWTYTDEQREKRNWHDPAVANPYTALPQMSMFTYSLGDVAGAIAEEGEFNEFDLSRFFKAKKVKDSDPERYVFDNPDHVQDWLNFIRGKNLAAQKLDMIEGKKTPFPFGDSDLIQSLRHTVWYMSDVASCFAMADLLRADPFFQDYTVVVAAGNKAGQGAKALGPVEDAITNRPDRTRTITLSCGKLMTGVTVAPWTGIFMLRSTNSPESYFQAAFRVQSPWTRKVYGQTTAEIVKQQCYVFDFDPDRALTQVTEYNLKLTEDGGNGIEERVAEFISFLPIFCFDGGSLDELSPENILDVAHSGVGATMLAKRWRSASLVNVDNATLLKLKNDPELLKTLEQIESFRALTKEMETRLASESRLAKAKKEQGTLTKEQDEEKKENNKWRRELRDKLLKFAARIPVFMYLTDEREAALVEVIKHLDTGLFEKVTGLTLNDFNKMSAIGVFSAKNMNPAIWHFRRFEISNIAYAGGRTPDEMIGLWDTVVDQEGAEISGTSAGVSIDKEGQVGNVVAA
jgi:hypothetical protein